VTNLNLHTPITVRIAAATKTLLAWIGLVAIGATGAYIALRYVPSDMPACAGTADRRQAVGVSQAATANPTPAERRVP